MSPEQKEILDASARRTQEFSAELKTCSTLDAILDKSLKFATSLLGADKGTIQLLDKQHHSNLEMVAQVGEYPQEFFDHFQAVGRGDGTVCGRALSRQEHVFVDDVDVDPEFAPHRAFTARAGIRSIQSFPLIGRTGQVIGVLSTQFPKPYRPRDEEVRVLESHLRQAAEFIERHWLIGH